MDGCTNYICNLRYHIIILQIVNNMIYNIQIKVMPLKNLLDPQGKAVLSGLSNLGLTSIQDVRVGKHITLQIEADTEEEGKPKQFAKKPFSGKPREGGAGPRRSEGRPSQGSFKKRD